MATQEVELALSPAALLTRCASEPFVSALDGGGTASWGCGHAVLGFRPRATLRVTLNGDAVVRAGAQQRRWRGNPFALLDRFQAEYTGAHSTAAEGLAGGIVVALSYELRHWVEQLPRRAGSESTLPVLHAAFYDWLLSYSYARRCYQLASAHRTRAELVEIAAWLRAVAAAPPTRHDHTEHSSITCNFSKDQYVAAVRKILGYIAAGDTYQVNLAQRFAVTSQLPAAAVFAHMQRQHPVPFAAYVDGGDFVLASNSPECFLSLDGDRVATFPIKGTRPRGTNPSEDLALAARLRADPKERAEHVMIVDLERNDLGRVCRFGSVRVDELAQLHTFPSLHHLISKVSGHLRPDRTLGDLLRATFPGGSITGAPKVRAMEIIDEIEPVGRGFYTGAIGFIGLDGRAVFNLLIRTAVGTHDLLTYHAGGGIVADSDPNREYEETLLKAQPFRAALAGIANE